MQYNTHAYAICITKRQSWPVESWRITEQLLILLLGSEVSHRQRGTDSPATVWTALGQGWIMDEMSENHRGGIFFIKSLAQVFMTPLGLNVTTPLIILLFMFPIGFDREHVNQIFKEALHLFSNKKRGRLGCDTSPSASDYSIIHVLLMVQRPLAEGWIDSIYDLFTSQGKIVILFITDTQSALS